MKKAETLAELTEQVEGCRRELEKHFEGASISLDTALAFAKMHADSLALTSKGFVPTQEARTYTEAEVLAELNVKD